MIRMSEVVLPGHPDKFCDQVADAIVAESYKADPRAYCQVEMSVWCDQVFLTGGIATRKPFSALRSRRAAGMDASRDRDRTANSSSACARAQTNGRSSRSSSRFSSCRTSR